MASVCVTLVGLNGTNRVGVDLTVTLNTIYDKAGISVCNLYIYIHRVVVSGLTHSAYYGKDVYV